MVRPVIHSEKHYVQVSIQTATAGVVKNNSAVVAVPVADKNLTHEVEEGSIIKAVYVEMWIRAGSTTGSSGQFIIYKKSSDTSDPTTTEMAALGDWDNKKNILYTTMGLVNDQDADAMIAYRGWLRIPKGKQRFGLGDSLKTAYFAPTVDVQMCGFFTYKEYT